MSLLSTCRTISVRVRVTACWVMIDWRSRGAHRAPVRWLWFSRIRLLLHLKDLTQFVPSANQICKRARPRGSWFPLISTLLWSFSGRGWKARPSLVAQLGGLLCFLRRLNYSATEISPLARFFSTSHPFLPFFSGELTIRSVYQCSPWHDTTQNKNKDRLRGNHIGNVNIGGAFHNYLRRNQNSAYSL